MTWLSVFSLCPWGWAVRKRGDVCCLTLVVPLNGGEDRAASGPQDNEEKSDPSCERKRPSIFRMCLRSKA